MLTKDEKELLEALKEQMDDEQKEAIGEMSEEELKEFLGEAKKEMMKAVANGEVKPPSKLKMMSEMSFSDFMTNYGGKSLIQAIVVWLLIKQSRGSVGGLLLALLIDIGVVVGIFHFFILK